MARALRGRSLDLTAPGDRLPEVQEVVDRILRGGLPGKRTFVLGKRGWRPEHETLSRIAPHIFERLIPPTGARIRITETPQVLAELREHLAPGTEYDAWPDPETSSLPVRITDRRTAVVRQHAARVRTPAGDVTLWPREYVILSLLKKGTS